MKRITCLILLCFTFISFQEENIVSQYKGRVEEVRDTSFLQSNVLNDSILYLALVHLDVKYPKVVLAQAKLESGNFTSSLFIKENNFLGLYNSRTESYFKFNHWVDCIHGYKNMVEYKLKEGEDYYKFLERIGYAEDSSYISKVKIIESSIRF